MGRTKKSHVGLTFNVLCSYTSILFHRYYLHMDVEVLWDILENNEKEFGLFKKIDSKK